ncbi:hypothetical protein BDR07DRAFT_699104 [Suillus spraguei]|nr:hypothetical protein BDR07DRAFT_699104 [Suillus spraguei]
MGRNVFKLPTFSTLPSLITQANAGRETKDLLHVYTVCTSQRSGGTCRDAHPTPAIFGKHLLVYPIFQISDITPITGNGSDYEGAQPLNKRTTSPDPHVQTVSVDR